MTTQKLIYRTTIILLIAIIWLHTYWAHQDEYDENYGDFIYGLLISTIASIVIAILWLKRKDFVRESKGITLLFYLTSSPLSIVLFINTFVEITGQLYFKL